MVPPGECNTSSTFLSTAAGAGGPSACATGGGGTDQTRDSRSLTGRAPATPSPHGNPVSMAIRQMACAIFLTFRSSLQTACGDTTLPFAFLTRQQGERPAPGRPSSWAGFGGTSVSAPMMAAIQALVNEKWSLTRVGNPTRPTIPSLKANLAREATALATPSISRRVEGLASTCTFYDITQGDNDIDCEYNGSIEAGCFLPSGTYGSLSTQALSNPGTVTAGGFRLHQRSHVHAWGTRQCQQLSVTRRHHSVGRRNASHLHSDCIWRSRHRHHHHQRRPGIHRRRQLHAHRRRRIRRFLFRLAHYHCDPCIMATRLRRHAWLGLRHRHRQRERL